MQFHNEMCSYFWLSPPTLRFDLLHVADHFYAGVFHERERANERSNQSVSNTSGEGGRANELSFGTFFVCCKQKQKQKQQQYFSLLRDMTLSGYAQGDISISMEIPMQWSLP